MASQNGTSAENADVGQGLSTFHDESALNQFMRSLEQPSNSIAEIGDFQIYFISAQAAIWILVFFAICFGVRWCVEFAMHCCGHAIYCTATFRLGKVVAFTFLLPLSLLLTLCGRCLFLAGAIEMFESVYNNTDWEKLGDYMVGHYVPRGLSQRS